jgi:hypothetical protein
MLTVDFGSSKSNVTLAGTFFFFLGKCLINLLVRVSFEFDPSLFESKYLMLNFFANLKMILPSFFHPFI